MKILFYTELWIEKTITHYRKHNVITSQHQIIATLLKNYRYKLDIKVLCNDGIFDSKEEYDKKAIAGVEYAMVTQKELKQIYPNYKVAAKHLYNKTFTQGDIDKYKSLIQSKLGNFEPDIIISYESLTTHLQVIYPNTLCLHQYFGVFSRYPFPKTYCFDPFGLYKDSLCSAEHFNKLALELTEEKTQFMNSIRKHYFDNILTEHDYTFDIIKEKRAEFNKIILLPLQGSNYFAFEENYDALNLFDYICDVLDKIDPSVGVLVTEHTARERVIDDRNIDYLRRTYPNFLYFEDLNKIKFHSQFLLQHVDGCAYVTSAVGLMSAFLQKPTFAIGKSQPFCSISNKIEDIHEILQQTRVVNYDAQFHYILNNVYVTHDQLHDSDFLYKYLQNMLLEYCKNHNVANFSLFKPNSDTQTTLNEYINSERTHEMQIKNTNKIDLDITKDTLITQIIQSHNSVVSFDLFDTLILRPFHKPSFLFHYMQGKVQNILNNKNFDFAERRVAIEKKIRKAKFDKFGYYREVTLDEIYNRMIEHLQIAEDKAEQIKNLELETELALCYQRKSLYNAYNAALRSGKKIIIITDTYFPKDFIEKLLKKNGYTNYDKLFCSSDEQYLCRKQDGKLYTKVLEELNCKANDILHIGDNTVADIENAKKYGFKTYHVTKTIDALLPLGCNAYKQWEEMIQSYNESIFAGVIANKLYDDHTQERFPKTLFDGKAYNLALHGLAGIMFSYAKWLAATAVQHGYQKLYFLAREGDIMKKVYDIVSPYIEGAPKSHYLLCSRRAVMVSSLYTLDDIQNYILKTKDIKITLDHIFTKQLGVDSKIVTDEICTMYQIRDRYQIINLLGEHKKIADILKHFENEILENAHNEREMYLQYLSQNGLESGVNANAAVVDIGYGGTMQMLLGKLTNQKLGGLYLFTFDTAKEAIQSGLNCQGFLSNYTPQSWMQSTLKAGYIVSIFENILSNTDGSFVKFTNKMEPVFVYGNSQDKLTKILPEIHKGITDFANEIMRIFGKDALDINVPCQSLEGIINNYFTDSAHMDIMILEGLTLERNVNTLNETKVVPTQEEINQQVRKGVEIATIKKPYKWQESVNIMIARAEFLIKANSATPGKVQSKPNANNVTNNRTQRKMIKFVQEPEAFWRDVKFKPLKLFKPFFVKKETRQKFANFYMKYKG